MTVKKYLSRSVRIETDDDVSHLGLSVVTVTKGGESIISVTAEPFEHESEGVEYVDGEIVVSHGSDGSINLKIITSTQNP